MMMHLMTGFFWLAERVHQNAGNNASFTDKLTGRMDGLLTTKLFSWGSVMEHFQVSFKHPKQYSLASK